MPAFVPLEADGDADELMEMEPRAARRQRAPGSSGPDGASTSYGYAPRRQPSSPLPQPSPSAAAIRANVTAAAKVAAEGHRANERGEFALAARRFEEAFALAPEGGGAAEEDIKAGFLLSAANMYLKAGELAQAKEGYWQLLARPRLSIKMRQACEEKLRFAAAEEEKQHAVEQRRIAEAAVRASWNPTLLDQETEAERVLRVAAERREAEEAERELAARLAEEERRHEDEERRLLELLEREERAALEAEAAAQAIAALQVLTLTRTRTQTRTRTRTQTHKRSPPYRRQRRRRRRQRRRGRRALSSAAAAGLRAKRGARRPSRLPVPRAATVRLPLPVRRGPAVGSMVLAAARPPWRRRRRRRGTAMKLSCWWLIASAGSASRPWGRRARSSPGCVGRRGASPSSTTPRSAASSP